MVLASYRKVQSIAEAPRAAEHRLVAEITREMIDAWESGRRGAALMPALHRNRELWSTFSAVCGAEGNALPGNVRAGIISLALWVDRHTSEVATGREPIDPLLDVNRTLLQGLAPSAMAPS